jgi:hypothetical protein
MKILDGTSRCVEDARLEWPAMPNVEVQLMSKMPGFLIPTRVERHAAQAMTLCRYTPAKYRFDAAAAYNADQATPNMVGCPQIRLFGSV